MQHLPATTSLKICCGSNALTVPTYVSSWLGSGLLWQIGSSAGTTSDITPCSAGRTTICCSAGLSRQRLLLLLPAGSFAISMQSSTMLIKRRADSWCCSSPSKHSSTHTSSTAPAILHTCQQLQQMHAHLGELWLCGGHGLDLTNAKLKQHSRHTGQHAEYQWKEGL